MTVPDIRPEWRTDTVTALCLSMREAQDFGALPILADALQDAGCPDDSELLARLRKGGEGYALTAGLVGCVLSAETEEAVRELVGFGRVHDCPEFVALVNAATGHHDESRDESDPSYVYPAHFWELVQKATGMRIPECDRATSFSCSC